MDIRADSATSANAPELTLPKLLSPAIQSASRIVPDSSVPCPPGSSKSLSSDCQSTSSPVTTPISFANSDLTTNAVELERLRASAQKELELYQDFQCTWYLRNRELLYKVDPVEKQIESSEARAKDLEDEMVELQEGGTVGNLAKAYVLAQESELHQATIESRRVIAKQMEEEREVVKKAVVEAWFRVREKRRDLETLEKAIDILRQPGKTPNGEAPHSMSSNRSLERSRGKFGWLGSWWAK